MTTSLAPPTIIYVLRLNDFPIGAYSSRDNAQHALYEHRERQLQLQHLADRAFLYYGIHEFTIDTPAHL